MSADRPRKAGAPAFPKREPTLRLVKNADERPRFQPDPELKAIVEDMNRRARAQREQSRHEPDGPDAA